MTPRAKPISTIMEETAREFGCTKDELLAYNRGTIIDEVRSIAMHLARTILADTEHSTTSIGDAFKRDHSTVINNSRKIRQTLREWPGSWLAGRVAALEQRIITKLYGVETFPQESSEAADLPSGQQPTVDGVSAPNSSGGDR